MIAKGAQVSSFIRIQDIADILIMTILIYQLYSWFRRTRTMQVLFGLGVVTLIYFATRFLGLYMTSWILQELGTVLIVLVIVVFQAEIRQALYRFSHLRHLFYEREATQANRFHEIAESLFAMAARRTGAILVFQRSEALGDLALNGVHLDCELNPQIMETIFTSGTPLHDGAALVRDNRLVLAACHLPLTTSPDVPQYLGTRHRAALGLSEKTDAVVVVVSEERGAVSMAVGSELTIMDTPGELEAALNRLINPVPDKADKPVSRALFSNLFPKMAILLMVTLFWLLVTSRSGQISTVTAPVRLHGIPKKLALVQSSPESVEVRLKSYSLLTPIPSKLDIVADVDLSEVKEGYSTLRIRHSDFNLPSGMVINSISPASIRVATEKKIRKRVPVTVSMKGAMPHGPQGGQVMCEPAEVEIEGPASRVERIASVATEVVEASQMSREQVLQRNLVPPANQVAVLRDEPVVIRLLKRSER